MGEAYTWLAVWPPPIRHMHSLHLFAAPGASVHRGQTLLGSNAVGRGQVSIHTQTLTLHLCFAHPLPSIPRPMSYNYSP